MPTGTSPRAAIPKAAALEVGHRIRTRRLELGLTQAALAGDELTKQLISQIEGGRTRPSPATLALVANRLGVTADALIGPGAAGATDTHGDDTAYRLRSAEALLASRQPDRARDALRTLGVEKLTPAQRLVYHRLAADIALSDGNPAEALANALVACRHAADSQDAEQIALAHNAVGRAQFELNRLVAALTYFDAAVESAQRGDVDPALVARIHTNRGNALMRLGDPDSAAGAYEAARLAAENAENLRSLALAHMGLGESSRETGDYSRAIVHMESAVELFDRLENRQLQVRNLHNLGEALAEQGNTAAARGHHEAALAAATAMGDALPRGYALERLAAHDVAAGAGLRALRQAQEAVGIARDIGDGDLRARALATVGDACQVLGDIEQADAAYEDALSTAHRASGRALRQVLMQQGAMLRARGDFEAATQAFEAAARTR
jgi:tetratricopeptide (TPR) repeat protein